MTWLDRQWFLNDWILSCDDMKCSNSDTLKDVFPKYWDVWRNYFSGTIGQNETLSVTAVRGESQRKSYETLRL